MHLGEIILEYRKEHGMSQNAFAEKCTEIAKAHGMTKGISNGYVSMLENNLNPKSGKAIVPSFQTYLICAEAMGESFEELKQRLDPYVPVSARSLESQVSAFESEQNLARQEKIRALMQLAENLSLEDLESVQKIVAALASK